MRNINIQHRIKAVGLLSGGLDSTLAAKVIIEQGIEVYAINFTSPFCTCTPKNAGCAAVVTAVKSLGDIPLKHVGLGEDYLEMIRHPKHGYGSGMNPCIDCRIMKLRKAGEYMREIGASFLFTGEVLGQRPMSQHRQSLDIIERESGFAGLIVRPLSAQLLPPSFPEQEGWLDRNRLLDMHGRTRKPQIALADDYGIADYPCPAGGCLLTVKGFASRIQDIITHDTLTLHEVALLKVGRHFRLSPRAKLIVGRNQQENERLENLLTENDIRFEPLDISGPVALGRGQFTEKQLHQSLAIVARYCSRANGNAVTVTYRGFPDKVSHTALVKPLSDNTLSTFRL